MIELRDRILFQMAAAIQRKSVTSCSRYAMNYRIMGKPIPGPVRFDRHPWSREMHDTDKSWVGPKAAQMGYTETALDRTFYTMDILKNDVLYLLPKKSPDATDFSKGRFDAALELSRHLNMLFSNTRNVGHKQAGSVNLYIRGTRSKSAVKSLPVALLILDELDEMVQQNLPQAEQRLSGQDEKQIIKISTPTVPDFGIDKAYQGTTKEHFNFKCPRCGVWVALEFPNSLVVTSDDPNDSEGLSRSHIICPRCKGILPHEGKVDWLKAAQWIPTENKTAPIRGFWIPQFYSTTVSPPELAKKSLLAESDQFEEQEWWNSSGGRSHVVAGAQITDDMIEACRADYQNNTPSNAGRIVTMGVDVGYKFLHYEIDEWFLPAQIGPDLNMHAVPKVLSAGKVESFEELHQLMRDYQIRGVVVDANPEHRKAYEFAIKFDGYVWLCYYGRGVKQNEIKVKETERTITVNRTSWLDLSLGRFKRGRRGIVLPNNIGYEYTSHLKALIRQPKKDADGNPTVLYVSTAADHHGHSRNYAEMALPLAVSRAQNTDVGELL